MMLSYVFLISGWIAYFVIHSVLAASGIKQKYHFPGYRVAYVLVSVAGLLILLLYNGSIQSAHFFESRGFPRYISLMLTTFGVMIIQASFRKYSFRGFVGLTEEEPVLKTDGVLSYVRHPIYSGLILIIVGFFLFIPNLPTLISCLCMLIYIPVGMMLEERKLVATYGNAYEEYRNRVPALFPNFK
jgi:protein-S-isoprenylcysteine O-methyltransferase Ste14